jgi:hypothetical protein
VFSAEVPHAAVLTRTVTGGRGPRLGLFVPLARRRGDDGDVALAAASVAACAAVAAVAVGVLTRDGDEAPNPANRAALAHQAEQYVESLESRAATVPAPEPANRAALQHQVEQYVEWLESRAASVSAGDPSTDDFVPGIR